MRKRDEEVINIQGQLDNIMHTDTKAITFRQQTHVGQLDWDKIKTVEDVVTILKLIYDNGQPLNIYAYEEHHASLKHLMKEEDNSEDK